MAISLHGTWQSNSVSAPVGSVGVTLASAAAGDSILVWTWNESSTAALNVSGVTVAGATDGSQAASQIIPAAARTVGFPASVECWLFQNVTTTESKTVTATFSGGSPGTDWGCQLAAAAFAGGSLTDVVGHIPTAGTGSAANPSLTVTTTRANSAVVMFSLTFPETPTADTGYTQYTGTSAAGIARVEYDLDVGAAGNQVVTANMSSAAYIMMALELRQTASALGSSIYVVPNAQRLVRHSGRY